MRSEIKVKCLGLPSSIYLIKSSICLWYFPKQKKRYFVYLGVVAHHHWWLVQGREATTQVSLSWSPQPSGPHHLTPHQQVGLPNQADHNSSHHTTSTPRWGLALSFTWSSWSPRLFPWTPIGVLWVIETPKTIPLWRPSLDKSSIKIQYFTVSVLWSGRYKKVI